MGITGDTMQKDQSQNVPFFDDSFPSEAFAGRVAEREDFESLTVTASTDAPKKFVWIVEGNKDLGKSTFLQWCEDRVQRRGTHREGEKRVVVCRFEYPLAEDVPAPQMLRELYAKAIRKLMLFNLKRLRFYPLLMLAERFAYVVTGLTPSARSVEVSLQSVIPQISAKLLVARLTTLLRGAGKDVGAFVFLIDEISSQRSPNAIDNCAALAQYITKIKVTPGMPNVGLVLALLPEWETQVHGAIHPQKHVSRTVKLTPLSPGEVRDCIRLALDHTAPPRWRTDDEFAATMTKLTGGLPRLIQLIGHNAAAKNVENRWIRSKDLQAVVSDNDHVHEALESVWFSAGAVPSLDPQIAREILTRLADKTLVSDTAASEGISEGVWQQIAIGNHGEMKTKYEETFQAIWKHLQAVHVVARVKSGSRSQNPKYRFAALAVRRVLPDVKIVSSR